ncbi:quinone-dependent dihydroorotate dehydrogenase [Sphingomonas sp.]|uniref:quinone-dependent dihydroorotate dehydrogenase n=1 Tax=Sphingomonas sp. TaxID=28214 RepID=UPI0025FB9AD7|nr:quinone-dependent dihydroorotate dehydrogenase [Sphingomonas sp.]
MIFAAIRPLLFRIDPERAHRLTIRALRLLPPTVADPCDPRLAITIAGLTFPNPVGLAAGFDKDADVPDAMLRLGFGSVEIGTITPLPQVGNPKPRLFRLAQDGGVINRMGFNNKGQPTAHARLSARRRTGIVGVNIGANKDAANRIADYATGVRAMTDVGDYLAINISSPNTPGLRALQDAGALRELLAAVRDARASGGPPVFLKVAPDLEPADIADIVRAAIDHGIDALIVANTTLSRPPLTSRYAVESGGLSGAPLRSLALDRLRDFRGNTGGQLTLIAAGGIASADDAYARIRAGASLVQLYSALVYEGPGLAKRITRGLLARLEADGFGTVAEAVG